MHKEGYWIYEWEDETSRYDPKGYWVGLEYFARKYRMWIPNEITEEEDIDEYIDSHCDDPDVWVDDE